MNENRSFLSNIGNDLPASIVVFLVAMPLCLGIALASGAPLFSGIIAGIVGGTVVALLSGSPLGVSGPAAGLAVIVLNSIAELGDYRVFLVAVVLAGIFQVVLGFMKAGIIGYYFPSSVIKGMLSGIGLIIILKQIPHAVGYHLDPGGDLAFQQMDGQNTFSELINMIAYINPAAVIITVISLLILILWERPFIKKMRLTKIIQGPLVVVIVGILLSYLFSRSDNFGLRADQMVSIPVSESIGGFFQQFSLPDFSALANSQVYIIALTIAIVASLETLLCVEATDKLDPMKRVTPTNRELKAQGIGNIISGMVGGLPITQVIVRSSANIQSGGKTKASAFFHGLLLLISAMLIPVLLNRIPLASLATILLLVGFKLAKPALFKETYKAGMSQFIPFMATVLGIVFTDLLVGIGLGLLVGIFQILWNNYKVPYHFDPEDYKEGEPVKINLSEDVSFLNKASIMQTLNKMPDGSHVIVDASQSSKVDPDILEIFSDFSENAKTRDIQFELKGLETDRRKGHKHLINTLVSKKPNEHQEVS